MSSKFIAWLAYEPLLDPFRLEGDADAIVEEGCGRLCLLAAFRCGSAKLETVWNAL